MNELKPLDDDERSELIAYLDGELDKKASRAMESKIQLNPSIRAEAETLRKTWELLDYLPKVEPSPTFTHRTLKTVSALKAKTMPNQRIRLWRPMTIGIGWAAAVLLAGAVGYAGMSYFLPREVSDEELVRDLRVIENKKIYEQVDDLEFLRQLDHPDLFGDENDS